MAIACRWGWGCLISGSPAGLAGAGDVQVAVDGNDSWSGHVAQSDAPGTAGPKATLAATLEASRLDGTPPRRIILGPGRHYVNQTVVLDARDAGLTVAGAGAGQTIVYGGRRITGWRQDGPQFVYHMWDELLVGLAAHDPATRTLTFARPAAHPAGAFGVNTYVVWNVREGMTEPGQLLPDGRFDNVPNDSVCLSTQFADLPLQVFQFGLAAG